MHRVVVTGLGAASGAGASVEDLVSAIFDEARQVDLRCETIPTPRGLRISRASVLLLHAVERALESGRLSGDERAAAGLVIGTFLGPSPIGERALVKPEAVGLVAVHGYIGALVGNVSIPHQLRGRGMTDCSFDTAGTCAISIAAETIRGGRADILIAGATESPTPLLYDPILELVDEKDCSPQSEGAGVLLIESLEHAQERGAPILCEILATESMEGGRLALQENFDAREIAATALRAAVRCGDGLRFVVLSGMRGGQLEAVEREALARLGAVEVVRPRERLGYAFAASGALQAVLAASHLAASQEVGAAALVLDCGLFGRANALALRAFDGTPDSTSNSATI